MLRDIAAGDLGVRGDLGGVRGDGRGDGRMDGDREARRDTRLVGVIEGCGECGMGESGGRLK